MTRGLAGALVSAIDALDELGLRYAVVGGLAVGAWGVNRSTRDADLYAELTTNRRSALQTTLEARGFHVPAMEQELAEFGLFRSRSSDGVFVDVFDAVGPLGQELLARRRRVEVLGKSVWVTAPEELVILKAFSERERDFEDLVSLARVPELQLDLDHIYGWSKRLDDSIGGNDVTERLQRAFAAARVKTGK